MPIQPLAEPCSFGLTDNERIVTFPGLMRPEPNPNIINDKYKLDIEVALAKNK